MHLCFVCHEYPPYPHGGIGVFVQSMAGRIAEKGHRVSVLGLYDKQESCVENGVEIHRFRRLRVPRLQKIVNQLHFRRLLSAFCSKHLVDIVEAPDWDGILWPPSLHCSSVIRMNGSHIFFDHELGRKTSSVTRLFERAALFRAHRIVAVSRYVARVTAGLLSLDLETVKIIPNAIDTNIFTPVNKTEDSKLILFVGTINPKKGVFPLIHALVKVLEQHYDWHFVAIGSDTFVENECSLISRLMEYVPNTMKNRIKFVGRIPHQEIVQHYQKADICVFPSFMEACPISWLEAMASGCCVLGSLLGPGAEIIEDGKTGILCDPRDWEDISRKLEYLISDRTSRLSLGKAARRKTLEKYSLNKVVNINLAFYEQCLETRKSDSVDGYFREV